MKIIKLEAANVKRLVAVEITPKGDVVEIRGQNAAGKSSVLDAIAFVLGGARLCPAQPIRKGAAVAHATVTLDELDLTVTRKWTAKGSYLTITNADGAELKSPQKILDDLAENLSFDPFAFSRWEAAKQREALLGLLGIEDQLRKLADIQAGVYGRRKEANAEVKRLTGAIETSPAVPDGTPTEPVSVAALADELNAANEKIAENTAYRQNAEKAVASADRSAEARLRAQERVCAAEAALASARHEFAGAEELRDRAAANRDQWAAHVAKLEDPDTAPIREQMQSAETVNQDVANLQRRRALQAEQVEAGRLGGTLQGEMDTIETQRQALLSAAKFPVEGLGFSEVGVTFGGLPLEQASASEQLKVSLAIAMAMNPKLRVLLVRDGSLLDEKSLKIMQETITAADFQLWLERVGTDGEAGVVIEDGMVKGAEAAHAPSE